MNAVGKAPACVPTWHGHIETTKDALLVFEACFSGVLSHCFRRPHDRERNSLIVSGNVFVYEEATSGIKRWTDGIPWSPSRILTNFLIYRQLNSPFPPGEKKRATKRSQRPLKPGEPYPSPSSNTTPSIDAGKSFSPHSPPESPALTKEESPDKDANRGLVGSLVDSYEFKENGLLKKTMTVTINGVQHHLVSYYSLDDAKHRLNTPRDDSTLKDLPIREPLLNQPKFKFPNLDDAGDGTLDQLESAPNAYAAAYYPSGYDTSRMYQGTPHAIHHAVSSMAYHPSVYAPSHPPSGGAAYASMPPTTSGYPAHTSSGYAPITSAVQYPPQHHHQNQYYQHQIQPLTHYHQQQQQQQQPQQQHQQQHQQPQSASYQPQSYAGHHQAMSNQQVHPSNIKSEPGANTLPRPNTFDYLGTSQNEAEMYGPQTVTAAPQAEGMLPLSQAPQSQTWPLGYSSQWPARTEGASYPSYRTHS